MSKTEWWINVNKHRILANIKAEESEPPVRISKGKYGKPIYCFEAELPEKSRIIYDPLNPILPCGARLAIVTNEEPKVVK